MGTNFSKPIRCLGPLATVVLLALVLGMTPQSTLGQATGIDNPLGAFQLEGNATSDGSNSTTATQGSICFSLTSAGAFTSPAAGGPVSGSCPSGFSLVTFAASTDDWQNALGGFGGGPSHALVTSFEGPPAEPFNSGSDTTFFGGGSKDTSGISSGPWEYATTSVNAKDDIEHAFAAAYVLPGGDIGIYFGMDRYDNSGDATAGFWFLQDGSVGLSGVKKGGGLLFSGHHTNNDLLIVSDFSTGGAVGTIQAFKWSCSGTGAACDSAGSLVAITGLITNPTCNPLSGARNICAEVNGSDGLASPWGFSNKSGQTTYAHGEFLEGGVDLNFLFGANIPCISTFMPETRSSNSPTASLEDVGAPKSFPLCKMTVSKSCNGSGTINGSGNIDYSFQSTVSNQGIGAIYNIVLNETYPDGTTGTINVSLPDTCNGTACLKPGDTATVNPIPFTCNTTTKNCPTPLDVVNTVTASGSSAPTGGSPINSEAPAATAECKTQVGAKVTVKKACDATNGGATLVQNSGEVVVEVFYTAQVCNNTPSGSQPETLTNVIIEDDHDSSSDTPSSTPIASLAPGCTTVTGHYFPSKVDNNVGRFGFSDTIRVTSATGSLGINPSPVIGCTASTDLACDTITCPICFDSVCTGLPQPSDY